MLWLLLLAAMAVSMAGCGSIDGQEESSPADPEEAFETSFEIHYIDVGQADAALVLCDGAAMLIDGGNKADSGLIYAYLKAHNVTALDYIVCTHPHEDHAGGLAAALNVASAAVAYAPLEDDTNDSFRDFRRYLAKQGVEITVPNAGDTFSLGSASVTVAGPVGTGADGNVNNTSIVLRIVYGETSFLFTGDAEREEELAILEAGYEIQSTVLKVAHHGGASSTTYPFLREAAPEYAVISVGEGNLYGHPAEAVMSRLQDADVTVYRTDRQGTVICRSDGKTVSFTGTQQAPEVKEERPDADYVLNIRSKKFHRPACQSVSDMKETNRQDFTGERATVMELGYTPCGRCKP